MPKSLQRCVTSLSVSSKVPSSSRKSMRSRADILPSLCCRSRRSAPPPSWASWSRFFSSAIFSSSFIGRHYRRARSRLRPRGRGVKQIQKFNFLFRGQERSLKGIARQFSQVFVGEAERLLHQRVLLNKRCLKHGWIVGVEGQHQSLVEVAAHRMLRKLGAAARPQIAGHADFNRNLVLGQLFDQFRILRGSKAVADAFRFEVQRAPDGFRPGIFTRVRREMKTALRGARVNSRKPFCWPTTLVAANAEGNYVAIAKLDGQIEHALGLLGAELPDGVEYPQQRDAEVFLSALAATFQALENRGEILLA